MALIGYGRMGKKIETCAAPHQIVAKYTRTAKQDLSLADVWIDFSHPEGVLEHVRLAAAMQKPLVIGTTGWDQERQKVKEAAQGIGVIYSPNFSLGVHRFKALLQAAAALLEGYEAAGVEMHHRSKADAPSGTAKLLQQAVRGLNFSSVRCGSLVGEHTVLFDSDEDTITLNHQAKSRDAFAKGAVKAAEWIIDKKGFFTMDDLLKEQSCKGSIPHS